MIFLLLRMLHGDALSGFAAGATQGELAATAAPIHRQVATDSTPKVASRGRFLDMAA